MFTFITNLIDAMGAFGVGVVMFLENIFPPIPSELVMPLAGFLAASGKLSLLAVFLWGTIGSVFGAWIWYEVGRRVGRARLLHFIDSYGVWLTLSRDDINRAVDWFDRHDKAAVFFGRMVPGVRTLISVPAGLANMGLWQFCLYTAIGSTLWNVALIAAGYLLQANYDHVVDYVNPVTNLILGLFLAAYVYRVIQQLWARRQRKA